MKTTEMTFKKNPKENLEIFLDYDFYRADYNFYVEMIEYIMCWTSENEIDRMLSYFKIPTTKSIGFKITFLYFIKNNKPSDILTNNQNKKKYTNSISELNRKELLEVLKEFKKSYELYFYDETVLFAMANGCDIVSNDLLMMKNKGEIDYFTENILTLNPRLVYKIINAIKMNKKYNFYKNQVLYESPYHIVYYYYKDNIENFGILSYVNLKNIDDVYKLYDLHYEANTYEDYPEKMKYCCKKYIKDHKFLSDSEFIDTEKYDSYLKYNYFINYVVNEGKKMINDTCECNGDIKSFEILINTKKISEVFFQHLNSKEGQLFVYDFDDTLSIPRHKVWDGLLTGNKGKSNIIPKSIEILSQASKINKAIILTKRNPNNIKDIEQFIKQFDINAVIIPMRNFLNTKMSKCEVLNHLWSKLPKFANWKQVTNINELYFCDDLVRNMDGFNQNFIDQHHLKKMELNLISLKNEYFTSIFSGNN